jgi:hypothetical protein
LNFCKRARAFWLIAAMLHHFMREQEIFGWNWGGKHKGAYLKFGAIICPITEVLHFPFLFLQENKGSRRNHFCYALSITSLKLN